MNDDSTFTSPDNMLFLKVDSCHCVCSDGMKQNIT